MCSLTASFVHPHSSYSLYSAYNSIRLPKYITYLEILDKYQLYS